MPIIVLILVVLELLSYIDTLIKASMLNKLLSSIISSITTNIGSSILLNI